MTVVVLVHNCSAAPEFDKLFPDSSMRDIIAVARHVGVCPCVLDDGLIRVPLDAKAAINSVGQFGVVE
jgi:hypothetical protein